MAAGEFKVVIVGGGLGGLCLAQGLKRAGIEFAVFERDTAPTSRLQGYRLSMTPDGLGALHQILSTSLWQRVEQACTQSIKGISFVSEKLEPRFFKPTPPPIDSVRRFGSISRVTLREILLQELGDRVHFGRHLQRYVVLEGGNVRCDFADGSSAQAQLLVGCDGTHSVVRQQLLPGVKRIDTNVYAIAGQVPLDETTRQDFLPEPLVASAVVTDSKPQGMFLASHQLDDAQESGENYVFWSFLTAGSRFPADLERLTPEQMIQLVDEMTPGWHPRLKSLIRRADRRTALVLQYRTSARPEPWTSGPVTLLGDAIHNMPPTGGEGANMALKDAAMLCEALATPDGRSLLDAVNQYETKMRSYAFAAVETSMVNLRRMVTR